MFHPFKAAWLPALALLAGQSLWAQATVPRVACNPLDPQAPTANIAYQSVFADYRSWTDEPIKAWREANEEVGRSGGHTGHAGHSLSKGATTGTNASPAQAERPAAPSPVDHADHQMK